MSDKEIDEIQEQETDFDVPAAESEEADAPMPGETGEAAPDDGSEEQGEVLAESSVRESKYSRLTGDDVKSYKLTGMYKDWFLDYASYVILERAVPHLEDGLKPVQRRILHSMKRMDDGRYNKVANIIGHTMQFHPHGDASIGDALVQLGQKDILVDCQGNWGNILTGDSAAAPRYIEARLSKLALDVVFNPKTTGWMLSYDGRNQEPVTLPVKFPLLLAQGVEGIAVGLASKILPHNFIELIEASIAYLQDKPFEIYPDFPTGGMIDCSKYNDGLRGGAVKVRAKITKTDRKTLTITEIPFGKTTTSVIDSILKANEKGKIKIRKVDDNTASNVEIVVHLTNDVSPDKTIDALYAFTDCEVSISPNSCVIYRQKPLFIGVGDILRRSVDNTRELLGRELEIRLNELNESWHLSSLEKIFIENRIYLSIEECTTWESVLATIDKELEPYKKLLRREVTREDIVKLTEIKIKRISKYDTLRADEYIKSVEAEIEQVERDLDSLTNYTISYYKKILKAHSAGRDRRTEIRNFDTIEASKVVVANAKLHVNRAEGFYGIGPSMRKDEFVADCSDIDDVILFDKNGKYMISRVSEKGFFRKNIMYVGVFRRMDERTIYNVIYRDGKNGAIMMKRCAIKGVTRDREYDITKGTPGSEILYMSVNPNGEAETLKIYFKPRPRLKKLIEELDFSTLAIKGRSSLGNLLTRYAIHKIVLKERGVSTLGGQNIWFDRDIRRLNTDGRGQLLGEFSGDDRIIIFTRDNAYVTCGYDLSQHFPDDMMRIEKWDQASIYTVVYIDNEQQLYYIKRFSAESSDNKPQHFLNPEDTFVLIADDKYPQLELVYSGRYAGRAPELIDADDYIGVKSHRAKGKRLSNLTLEKVNVLEPLQKEEAPFEPFAPDEDEVDAEPMTGIMNETAAPVPEEEATEPEPAEEGEEEQKAVRQMELF